MKQRLSVILLLSLVLLAATSFAQDDPQPADITNDEGGVTELVGSVEYTVGFLPDFGAGAVVVLLSDSSSIIDRNLDPLFVLEEQYQLLGRTTSDPLTSPFTYQISLPINPPGQFRDVDNDGEEDQGVIVLDVSVFINMFGNPYFENDREYGAGFTSVRGTDEFELRNEVIGGSFIVWAPDDQQGFPSGFGEDGLVFTEDDPIVLLPAGYTVVNMDTDPFTFDRSASATVDLFEQEQSLQPADYSDLSYVEAFDALVEQMREEYAFTEYKNIDWDALIEEFRPRFEAATENEDPLEYQRALRDFSWAIPDGHVGANTPLADNEDFPAASQAGLGMAIRELDDGRIIVNFLTPEGPAEAAGIELRAEILEINGTPTDEFVSANIPYSSPFSTSHNLRLQQLRYAMRFPVDEEVEVTYQNPEDSEPTTVTLTAVVENQSFAISSFNRGAAPATALPVEFEILDSGYGYVRVNTFSDDPLVMLRLWENMILTLNQFEVPGLIIDLRWNGGGYNIYNQMAGYFFTEELLVGNDAEYYPGYGFFVDPQGEERIQLSPDGLHYDGELAVIVSPNCASACEFFAYTLALEGRSAVIGHYPTAGLGGSITPVFMPDDVYFQFTVGRALNAEGDIRFEGVGVEPTVVVPVNEETLFYEGDVLLDAAVTHLDEATTIPITAELTLGESVAGTLVEGAPVRYSFTAEEEVTVDIVVSDGGAETLDTVLRVYDTEGNELANNDDAVPGERFTSELLDAGPIPAGFTLIIEVAGFDASAEGDFTLTVSESGAGEGEAEAEPTAEATANP